MNKIPENKSSLLRAWNEVKISLHATKRTIPQFSEGEIWWAHLGENVGSEINGKNANFTRPVLILRKLNKEIFLGIPLTTKHKSGIWYTSFRFQNKTSIASLVNTSSLSALRLCGKRPIGIISQIDLVRIRTAYYNLIFGC